MKIDNIHIDGFGVWNEKDWAQLGPGLNVFHGPNEKGKSTLMAFVRSILFGFDRRGSARRYDPLNGGVHGGWLDVRVQDRPIRIERKAGRHVRGTSIIYDGDATGSESELEALLGGTTRTLYHNVFAFGLEELEQFHTLQDNEVAQHITGAGLGIGASKWTGVQRDIDARQSAMFLPRGQNGSINVALKELEAVREDLDRTEHQPEEYWAAHEARIRIAAEIRGLEEIVVDLKQRAAQYEKRLNSRPLVERRKFLEKALASLPIVVQFPEGGVERLGLLNKHIRALELEYEASRREAEQRRMRRLDLRAQADSSEYDRRVRIIEALRSLVPRVDATRRIYSSSIEKLHATKQEHAAHESAVAGVRPPSKISVFMFIGLICCGAVGIALAGHLYPALALIAVSLTPYLWYRRRHAGYDALRMKIADCADRLRICGEEVRKIEKEGRGIEAEIRKLIGKPEIAGEDISMRVADLEQLSKIAEELRRVEDSVARSNDDLQRIESQIKEQNAAVAALFSEASAANEAEFLESAEAYKQRLLLSSELDRMPSDMGEPAMLFDLHDNVQEAFDATKAELADMEERLVDVRHEAGRVAERIAIMERSEERSRLLTRQELILAKLDANAETWAVLTLCKTLLDETRKIYETERQPGVLRQASLFFKVMTEGRYIRVIAPLDGTEIQVERADGVRLPPQLLSRGTAEQLYLAMRLALVREYASNTDALPVVFDDVFVNFDPARTRNTLLAVRDLAETHQVLLFTCHPHFVDIVEEIVPSARIFPLQ
jgi:uncharacterized protein YhaN